MYLWWHLAWRNTIWGITNPIFKSNTGVRNQMGRMKHSKVCIGGTFRLTFGKGRESKIDPKSLDWGVSHEAKPDENA